MHNVIIVDTCTVKNTVKNLQKEYLYKINCDIGEWKKMLKLEQEKSC